MLKARATTQAEVDARETREAREREVEAARLRLTEIDRESVRSLREAILAMHGQASMAKLLPRIEALEAEAKAEREKLQGETR